MARALRDWAINREGKNSVRNLRYGPRTRLVRGIYNTRAKQLFCSLSLLLGGVFVAVTVVVCLNSLHVVSKVERPF